MSVSLFLSSRDGRIRTCEFSWSQTRRGTGLPNISSCRLLITSPPLSAGEDSETIYFIAVTMGVEPTFSFTYLLPCRVVHQPLCAVTIFVEKTGIEPAN